VKVQMNGGPFKIDADHESVLKPADWKRPGGNDPFGAIVP
jgi:hypothetical protein